MMIKILGIDDFSEIYNKRLVNDFPESEVKSLKKIIDMYKPLLIKESITEGVFDEDLYQELVAVLLQCIRTFTI